MSIATITFTDAVDGNVDIKIAFDGGVNDSSGAHYMAAKSLELLVEHRKQHPDEYED